MKPYLPIYYITDQNIRPHFFFKIFLPCGHFTFSLNNPPLSPIILKLNNIVTLQNIFFIGCFRDPYA